MSLGPIHSAYVRGRSIDSPGLVGIVTATTEYEWNLSDILALAHTAPAAPTRLAELDVLDEDVWFAGTGTSPTLRALANEFRQVRDADLDRPVLAVAGLGVVDGTHRIVRALAEGHDELPVVTLSLDELLDVPHVTRERDAR